MAYETIFFFIFYSYLNYTNITWASANKSNLIFPYRNQKYAIRINL